MKEKIMEHLRQELIDRRFKNVVGIDKENPGYYERSVYKSANALTEETKIIEDGYIDSFGLVSFRTWCEITFNVVLPDEIVTPKTFATVNDIVRLIESVREKK